MFQYRKRYGLHAIHFAEWTDHYVSVSIPQAVWIACNQQKKYEYALRLRFNTASGMDCMQLNLMSSRRAFRRCFNTASGMDCMQSSRNTVTAVILLVSIPQAVWIACNFINTKASYSPTEFQYRKRYGLHAIKNTFLSALQKACFNTASGMDCMQYCLPEALETVSPEVGFLILTPFSHFSPKCAELFCREKCFERGLKPVIARALLSTKEI